MSSLVMIGILNIGVNNMEKFTFRKEAKMITVVRNLMYLSYPCDNYEIV